MIRRRQGAGSDHPWAIVLAADVTGLGAVRGLRRAGLRTVAVVTDPEQPVLHSRYPVKRVVSPGVDWEASLQTALWELPHRPGVLIPTSDAFVGFLARHRGLLSQHYGLCVPSDEIVATFNDKAMETRRIAELGIPLPRTIQELPPDPGGLAELGFPLILKPRSSSDALKLGLKTAPIESIEALQRFYASHQGRLERLIAQELIPGGAGTQWECISVFDQHHELVSGFTFRKLSTSPPGFGVTCHGRVERNDELLDIACRLAKELGYTGPMDLDFKFDERNGRYQYLELNPRLGMCHLLGTVVGVNCVADAYRVASGMPTTERNRPQRDAGEYFNPYEELYGRYALGDRSLPTLLRGLAFCARVAMRRPVFPYFRIDDPWPGMIMTARQMRKFVSRRWTGA